MIVHKIISVPGRFDRVGRFAGLAHLGLPHLEQTFGAEATVTFHADRLQVDLSLAVIKERVREEKRTISHSGRQRSCASKSN